jgi:hypothetical protein
MARNKGKPKFAVGDLVAAILPGAVGDRVAVAIPGSARPRKVVIVGTITRIGPDPYGDGLGRTVIVKVDNDATYECAEAWLSREVIT